MEQKTKRLNYKLRGKKEIEDEIISNEHTPPKSVPRAHSSPFVSKMVSNGACELESNEESAFCFTQDSLDVKWDYNNTPRRIEKKKKLKPKKKTKVDTFSKDKRQQEFSPIKPVKLRKKYIKDEPRADLSKLISGLQALSEKVKEHEDLHEEDIKTNSPTESCINIAEEHLNDIEKPKDSCIIREQLLAHSPNFKLREEIIPITVNENYTSLFDDDADDCMVRCSQEVEQKLHKPDPNNCVTEEKCSSRSARMLPSKNFDLDINQLQNYAAMGKESLKIREDDLSLSIQLETENCLLSDTQKLKESCVLPTIPNLDLVKNIENTINESFTTLFEDDADDCMVLCSQEIEKELNDKNIGERLPSENYIKKSNSVSNSDEKLQTNYNEAKSDKASSTHDVGFDDSLDMLLQDFTEDDINKISKGVPVKKNVNSLTLNSNRYVNYENNLKNGSVIKPSVNCRIPVANKSVHQVTSYKQLKPLNLVSVANKLDSLTSSNSNCEVVSMVDANASGLKLKKCTPISNSTLVCGHMEIELNKNSTVHCMTFQSGTNSYSSTQILTSLPKTLPQKCTPEEIERKRLEAKKKLEMKKLSVMQEKEKYTNPQRLS